MRTPLILLCSLMLPATAGAQFIPPIPEATPATPEFVPPPPPEPPKPAPNEQQQPEAAPLQTAIASLVERDEDGKIIPLARSTERAAVGRLEWTEDQRAQHAAADMARRIELETKIVSNLPLLLSLRESVRGLEENADFGALVAIRDQATPVLPSATYVDYLARKSVLTPHQRKLVEQAVKEYEEARRADWQAEHGGDIMKVSTALVRDKLRQQLSEPLEVFDAMIARAAERGRGLRPEGLSAGAQASMQSMFKEAEKLAPDQRRERFRAWFMGLADTADQQAVLRAVALVPPEAEGAAGTSSGAAQGTDAKK